MFHHELSSILAKEPDGSSMSEWSRNELGLLRLMVDPGWRLANHGKHVAIMDGVLIATADSRQELFEKTRNMSNGKGIRIDEIGRQEEMVEISTPFLD